MSALGHKRTSQPVRVMSALPSKADIRWQGCFPGRQSQRITVVRRRNLAKRRQPLERGRRQRALLNRGECILELLGRCHSNQDGAYRWIGERKSRGRFG